MQLENRRYFKGSQRILIYGVKIIVYGQQMSHTLSNSHGQRKKKIKKSISLKIRRLRENMKYRN